MPLEIKQRKLSQEEINKKKEIGKDENNNKWKRYCKKYSNFS